MSEEQIIEHDISYLTQGERRVHGEQIGDYAHRISKLVRSAPARTRDTISAALYDRANDLWTQFMQSNRRHDLEEVIWFHRQALKLRPASHPERIMSLSNLASALSKRFTHSGRRDDLEEATSLHREAFKLLPVSHPDRSVLLINLASAVWTQFEQSGRRNDPEQAILLHRQALKLLPVSHPDRSIFLTNLASALWTRFINLSRRNDLEEAILLHRQALELPLTSYSDRCMSLSNLASALLKRFTHSGRRDDLEEAISLHREAFKLLPASHPGRSMLLVNVATAVWAQSEQSGQRRDLEEAILLHRQALNLRPTSRLDRSILLNNLASALSTRFKQSGRLEDLEEATFFNRQALKLRPTSHPERSMSLNNLASTLWTQFTQSGRRDDLEEAIVLHRQALKLRPASHPERYMSISNLALALSTLFTQSGRRRDLEEGILLHREALELRPDRPMFLTNLASALLSQFTQSGRLDDLEEAVLLHRQALELLPTSHPDRLMFLNNLASTLSTRFTHSGELDDLEEAILFHRQTLELRPPSHPDRFISLANLATALSTQFEQSGKREVLEEAVSLHREALELRPASHPDRYKSLNDLANTLWRRYEQLGRQEDLKEAIALHQAAFELRPSHPDRSKSMNNLALALWTQFTQSGRREDLEEAILLYRQALELLPASYPDRSLPLSNLALALLTQFKQLGRHEALKEAIDVSKHSLSSLVSGHPSTCLYSRNQGNIFYDAYSHTHESEYLHKAMKSFHVAVTCETAPASLRLQVAKDWASLAVDCEHDSALDAYRAAIRLLPRLAMLGLDLPSRHLALTSSSDGLARDAAACAIRSRQYDQAVELLEEGRAVFWSQALQLRTPMTDLRDVAPELAEKLRRISLSLEQGSLRDVSRSLCDDSSRVISMEQEASRFRRLNDEWLEALQEVRHLEGFQDFLRPSKLSTLLSAANKAPLVILNASHTGCAALILTPSGVQHVPFPDLTFANVTQLVELIQIATAPGSRDASLPEPDQAHKEGLVRQMSPLPDTLRLLRQTSERGGMTQVPLSDVIFPSVLAKLWETVVKPVIRRLGLEKSDVPSTLRWCATGPFAFLPIHAAGIYDAEGLECASDYVVSSYTPTISTLLRDTPPPSTPFKMVVIIQPELRNTVDELQRIENRLPVTKTQVPIIDLVKLESGTVEEVTSHLPTTSIIHFACHGTQNAQRPLESALLLKDGRPLTVFQIMQQSSPNAMLAFLAACQTATGDKALPDEVIHLGSTLLFAGFPGVVATMWNIFDADGPEIADTFYEYLFKESLSGTGDSFQPDTARAARALHIAVAKLRTEKKVSFLRWVPFIHLGR